MNIIDSMLCKGCDICISVCPKDVYAKSEEVNSKDVYVPYPANQEACVRCGLCEISCPDQALYVEREVE